MLETLIAGGIIGLLAIIIGVWIALKIQQQHLLKIQAQQEAWERAQEGHQRIWEVRQAKHSLEIEKKLGAQVQQVQSVWQMWEAQDTQRAQTLAQQYETAAAQLSMEYEVARLPRVEETPLPTSSNAQRQQIFANWQPPRLHGANLSKRDLSYRYLGRADLREAQLTDTIFYMSDLSGATLAGADLSGADLSGADLSGTDLRNTTLTNANLLVADLHNAVLTGANLRGARNLTPQQVYSAIYDSTTQLDAEVDVTMTRIPSVRTLPTTPALTPAIPTPTEATSSTQSTKTSASTDEQVKATEATNTMLPATPVTLPVLLSLPFDDSQSTSLATNSFEGGQEHEQADGAARRQRYNAKRRARAN